MMTVTRIGPVECQNARETLPAASLITPWYLAKADAVVLESGLPVIVGTASIYGPEHVTSTDLEIDYRRTLKGTRHAHS